MELSAPLALTGAGRPIFLTDETEIVMQPDVTLYDRDAKSLRHVRGVVTLTSQRLFWSSGAGAGSAGGGTPIAFALSRVERVEAESGFLTRSPKLTIHFNDAGAGAGAAYVKLSFKEGGRDAFRGCLQSALAARDWASPPSAAARPPGAPAASASAAGLSASGAGIGGLMRRKQQQQRQRGQLAEAAFSDLSALMEKAKPVVALVDRYAAAQARVVQQQAGAGRQQGRA